MVEYLLNSWNSFEASNTGTAQYSFSNESWKSRTEITFFFKDKQRRRLTDIFNIIFEY